MFSISVLLPWELELPSSLLAISKTKNYVFGKIWKSIDIGAFSFVSWIAIGIDSEYNINLHGNRLLVLVFLDLLYIFIELEVDLQVFSKLAWLISQCTMGAFIAPLISSTLVFCKDCSQTILVQCSISIALKTSENT